MTSFGRSWVLRRTYDNLRLLDTQLHQCVYDRKYSCLPELPLEENLAPIDDSLQVSPASTQSAPRVVAGARTWGASPRHAGIS